MIILFLLIIPVVIYSIFIEPFKIQIKTVGIDNATLIQHDCDKIKIVHISDLHIGKFGCRETILVDKINRLKPDILFVTGDFIKNDKGIKPCAEMLKKIKTKNGIYGVFGNNDYKKYFLFLRDTEELKKTLNNCGVTILFNESISVNIEGTCLNISGVDDFLLGDPDMSKIMATSTNAQKKILLSHSPSIINHLQGFEPDLILTGHTHGGQVRLPFIEYLWTPLPIGSPRAYGRGLFEVGNTKMYVNQGIGTNGLPLRFLCPPEITVFLI